MSKHTPGPWIIKVVPIAVGESWPLELFISNGKVVPAIITGADEEAQANARLIAAPELLDALKYARAGIGHDGGCLNRPTYCCSACIMDFAIAEAEGK